MENSHQPHQRTQTSALKKTIPWRNQTRKRSHRWRLSHETCRTSTAEPPKLVDPDGTWNSDPHKRKRCALQSLHFKMSFPQQNPVGVLRSFQRWHLGGWYDPALMLFYKKGLRFLRLLKICCEDKIDPVNDILTSKALFLVINKPNIKDVIRIGCR